MLKMMFKKGEGWLKVNDLKEAKEILEENSKNGYFTYCFYVYPNKETKLKIYRKEKNRLKEYEMNEVIEIMSKGGE